jgi:predicted Fe-Mo cluster-binding NifX family protein
MSWRAAVTSADGVLINVHFGHADCFYIFDVEQDGTGKLAEQRPVRPWCTSENQHKDGEEGSSGIADKLQDCAAVLTARIGPPAREKLELAGLTVFEQPAAIEDALKKLAAYYVKTSVAE